MVHTNSESSYSRFKRCQEEWEHTSQTEAARVLSECDNLRNESCERKRQIDEGREREAQLRLELEATSVQLQSIQNKNMTIEASLTKDFRESQYHYEQQVNKSREQDAMHYENQLKSRESKINRLEKEVSVSQAQGKLIATLQMEKLSFTARINSLLKEIDVIKADNIVSHTNRTEPQREPESRASIEANSLKLGKDAEKHNEFRKSLASPERAHVESLHHVNAQEKEIVSHKASVKEILKTSQTGLTTAKQVPTMPQKGCNSTGRLQFAKLNKSSDSLDDLDEFDFVHDTPPDLPEAIHTLPRRGKEREKDKKKRSLPIEIVHNTQEEPAESTTQSHAAQREHNEAARVGQSREGKVTRSRSSTRNNGSRKRKSN